MTDTKTPTPAPTAAPQTDAAKLQALRDESDRMEVEARHTLAGAIRKPQRGIVYGQDEEGKPVLSHPASSAPSGDERARFEQWAIETGDEEIRKPRTIGGRHAGYDFSDRAWKAWQGRTTATSTKGANAETLLDVIRVVRECPIFDDGGPLAEMMDDALAGKPPTLLDSIARIANGIAPTKGATPERAAAAGEVLTGEIYTVSQKLLETVWTALTHYSYQSTYMAPRLGGVLAGCPRGAIPTPRELTEWAVHALREIRKEIPAQEGTATAPVLQAAPEAPVADAGFQKPEYGSLADNLRIEQTDMGRWIVCVENWFPDEDHARAACRKWKAAYSAAPLIKVMVDRFLGWRLPQDFYPDCGITFKHSETWGPYPNNWPIGTNLFTADQARTMFEYVLASPVAALEAPASEKQAQLAVSTVVSDNSVSVVIHLKRGEQTAVLYSKNHVLNGTTVGTACIPVGILATLAATTASASGELVPCPICKGPAIVGPASKNNPAACGLPGWTADCQSGCSGAPYVTRLYRNVAISAWNDLVSRRAPAPSRDAAPQAPSQIKTWQERVTGHVQSEFPELMKAEIADLRAALAAQPSAAPAEETTEEQARAALKAMPLEEVTKLVRGADLAAGGEMPPLPEETLLSGHPDIGDDISGYTADQMREYGKACRAAGSNAGDAARYRTWRDNMIASDKQFLRTLTATLPREVGISRVPTASEWDAAIDAARTKATDGDTNEPD